MSANVRKIRGFLSSDINVHEIQHLYKLKLTEKYLFLNELK